MKKPKEHIVILIADDDEDDRLLTEKALRKNHLANTLKFVENGEELLDYLHQRNGYSPENAPLPGLILLDLNMPRMDGREALSNIKKDDRLRKIPVVILTSSKAEEDILRSYDLGGNSYITKPVTFEGLVTIIKELGKYWFEIVALPD